MTTPNNQPTPPDGYKLLKRDGQSKPLPKGALFLSYSGEWKESKLTQMMAGSSNVYAIPITVPETGDTHDCMGDDSPTLTEMNCVFGAAQAAGDTTNEKGGEPCATNAPILDTDTAKTSNVPSTVSASNAALDVQPVEQRQELLPCPFCGSDDIELDSIPDHNSVFFKCLHCGTRGPQSHRGNAFTKWNTRK